MPSRVALCLELLRMNRGFLAGTLRHDLALVAAGLIYGYIGFMAQPKAGITVQRGVFAALVLVLLAAMQAETLRRAAPGLRNMLVLPLSRATLLGLFYIGFALPGAIMLALAGAVLAFAGAATNVPGTAARIGQAILALLLMKSLVVNILIVLRFHVLLIAAYLILLTAVLLGLLILRDFAAPVLLVSGETLALLFVAASFLCTFAIADELEL